MELRDSLTEWNPTEIGKFGQVFTGTTPSTTDKTNYGDEYPFYGPTDLDKSKYLGLAEKNISKKGLSVAREIKKGSILFACIGMIGKMGISTRISACNQQINWIEPYPEFDTDFIYYALQNSIEIIKNQAATQVVPMINKTEFQKIKINVPHNLVEQKAIAEALSDIDGLIETVVKEKNKNEMLLSGIIESQFKNLFVENNINPKLGELVKSGDIFMSRGKVISKNDLEMKTGDFPVYSSSVHNQGLFGRYGDYMFDEELITWSVDGGGHFFHRPKHKFSITNVSGYMRIINPNIDVKYLSILLKYQHSHKIFDYTNKAHPSVIKKEYSVYLPDIEIQKIFSNIVIDLEVQIDNQNQELIKYECLKQGMMNDLLTGKVRLI